MTLLVESARRIWGRTKSFGQGLFEPDLSQLANQYNPLKATELRPITSIPRARWVLEHDLLSGDSHKSALARDRLYSFFGQNDNRIQGFALFLSPKEFRELTTIAQGIIRTHRYNLCVHRATDHAYVIGLAPDGETTKMGERLDESFRALQIKVNSTSDLIEARGDLARGLLQIFGIVPIRREDPLHSIFSESDHYSVPIDELDTVGNVRIF